MPSARLVITRWRKRSGVSGGEKPDQRAEQNAATAAAFSS